MHAEPSSSFTGGAANDQSLQSRGDAIDTEAAQRLVPFTSLVASLPSATPFVGPEALERASAIPIVARIGANESAFGPSPLALAAMQEAATHSAWYGDPENFELRQALADHHRVTVDEIGVDSGIDSLLGLAARLVITPGTTVVTSLGAYPTFNYHVAGFGGNLETVPYADDHEDLDGLLERQAQSGAPLVYLANPDNPMGTWHSSERINAFIKALPAGCLLLLDEAYGEFAPPDAIPPLDTNDPRVLRLRTFSKAYGMAGARIGYAIGHRTLITGLGKIRNHFGVNRIAQAGALAALGDQQFVGQVVESVAAGRRRIADFVARYGYTSLPSATNFVTVDMGGVEQAQAMLGALARAGVFIRMPGVAPLNRCIRIGVGRSDELEAFEQAFASAVGMIVPPTAA